MNGEKEAAVTGRCVRPGCGDDWRNVAEAPLSPSSRGEDAGRQVRGSANSAVARSIEVMITLPPPETALIVRRRKASSRENPSAASERPTKMIAVRSIGSRSVLPRCPPACRAQRARPAMRRGTRRPPGSLRHRAASVRSTILSIAWMARWMASVAPVAPKAASVSPSGMFEARPETRVSTRLCATSGIVSSRPSAAAAAAKAGTPGVSV